MIEDIRAIAEPPPVTAPPAPPAPTSESKPTPKQLTVKPHRVEVIVTDKGYEPGEVKVPRGRPESDGDDHENIHQAGTVTYACAMNMIKGTIVVQ